MPGRTLDERIAEYVDSGLMTHRIKTAKMLICRIEGNFGTYHTTYDLSKSGEKTDCTCPAEYWPCKHSLALTETYEIVPETFIDIKAILKEIQRKTKPELLEIIKKIIQYAPESLAALGIRDRSCEEEEH